VERNLSKEFKKGFPIIRTGKYFTQYQIIGISNFLGKWNSFSLVMQRCCCLKLSRTQHLTVACIHIGTKKSFLLLGVDRRPKYDVSVQKGGIL